MELLFAAFFTTASASTSLVLLLLQHPAAIAKIQQELEAQGLGRACSCGPGAAGNGAGPWPDCSCEPDLNLAALGRLRYVDCVVKEVLRLLPPVSGGYRTALRTFELDVSAPPAPPDPCQPSGPTPLSRPPASRGAAPSTPPPPPARPAEGGDIRTACLLFHSHSLHFPACEIGRSLLHFPRNTFEGRKPGAWRANKAKNSIYCFWQQCGSVNSIRAEF